MLDFITKTIETAYDVATLPVSIAVDAVTLGGALVDRDVPYTVSKGRRIVTNAVNAVETLAE